MFMRSTIHKVFICIYYIFFILFVIGVGFGIFNGAFALIPYLIGVVSAAAVWGIALVGCIICGGGLKGCGVYPFNGSKSKSSNDTSTTSIIDTDYSSSSIEDDDFHDVYPTDSEGNPMTDKPPVRIYSANGYQGEGDDGKKYERDTYGDGWHEIDD